MANLGPPAVPLEGLAPVVRQEIWAAIRTLKGGDLSILLVDKSLKEIANARHFPNVEHPDVFNRIMMGWLSKHR